jgi:hypothetical protein
MYAFTVAADAAGDNVVDLDINYGTDNEIEKTKLFYWRKFNALHGWMENLYRNKGGKAKPFNCVPVRLHPHDLDALQFDLLDSALPKTIGFFFGNNPPDADSLAEDLKFIQKARDVIAEGDAVYYDSWW